VDVHKPNPWSGFRGFLKEYLIIVVGVLTALGAGQAVEALNWARQVEAADAALKPALVHEAQNAAERVAQHACVIQRLAELSDILQRATESGRLPPMAALGHPPNPSWTIGAWNALVASQTVTHLPRDKMVAYTRIATRTGFMSNFSDQEDAQWTILDTMAGPGRRLSDVEAEQLRIALAQAAAANFKLNRGSKAMGEAVTATGLVGASDLAEADRAAAADKAKAAICRPIGAAGA
jgi:hypothetical protein